MDRRAQLLRELSIEFDRLRPQSIRPAEGFIRHDYLIPAGFYQQMWDWDGFFIGYHLACRGREEARYLKWWALSFLGAVDDEGYVAGCITTEGPRPIFGKFAMKPFLAQGAVLAARALEEFRWIEPVYEDLARVVRYREGTQLDADTGLFFWDNAMQSGADNNVALTNDENDRSAILAADLCAWQYREYLAMTEVAMELNRAGDADDYRAKADSLRERTLARLWFPEDESFFNVRRDSGEPVKRVTYSNFIPLLAGLLPRAQGRAMVERYLWNRSHLLTDVGLRTLSGQDPEYNNENTIIPYSNWQGPVWPIANYHYFVALKKYGFVEEAGRLAEMLGELMLTDIRSCGSMHENYHADTGEPLAPTAEQSEGGVFTGFVGWNLLVQNMLEGAVEARWALLEL